MTLTVRSIASGSSGNAYLLETERAALLLDAGLSARRLRETITTLSVDLDRLCGIIVTHEHNDHVCGAARLARGLGTPLYATAGTVAALSIDDVDVIPIGAERAFEIEDIRVTPFSVVHDAAEPVGLHIEHAGNTVAFAVDLGSADQDVREWMSRADLLVIDSNHDTHRLWNGPYHASLKRRIASPRGHLSNDQAADCIAFSAERGRVRWAWLAHLSETNNTHGAALAATEQRLAGAAVSVHIARRHRPSLVWRSTERYLQARLF